jgi:hypothetical protein
MRLRPRPSKRNEPYTDVTNSVDQTVVPNHSHQIDKGPAPRPGHRKHECSHRYRQREKEKSPRSTFDAVGASKDDCSELYREEELVARRAQFIAKRPATDAGGRHEIGNRMSEKESTE